MKVLDPLIASGKIKVVGDQWVDSWLAEKRYKLWKTH